MGTLRYVRNNQLIEEGFDKFELMDGKGRITDRLSSKHLTVTLVQSHDPKMEQRILRFTRNDEFATLQETFHKALGWLLAASVAVPLLLLAVFLANQLR